MLYEYNENINVIRYFDVNNEGYPVQIEIIHFHVLIKNLKYQSNRIIQKSCNCQMVN